MRARVPAKSTSVQMAPPCSALNGFCRIRTQRSANSMEMLRRNACEKRPPVLNRLRASTKFLHRPCAQC
eukprot:2507846-Rhodomonas_salina.2